MTKFTSLPPGHSLVVTQDGSETLFSDLFQEACHSTTGAKAETLLHYVHGCKIVEKSETLSPFCLLEVGFGLGVGFLTTLETLPEDRKWHFISLELDKNLLEWFKESHPEFHLAWNGNLLECRSEKFELTIIQGDARVELPKFLSSNKIVFHAIYQDAFSPKKNPSLWTKEWFSLLKRYSHEEVILSTYSASTSIRKSLNESGWGVLKGEKFGPKRTSTRAVINQPTDPDILLQLQRSPTPALTDLQIASITQKIES
jgi:tRNA U34 5-methylaminomethyl-2-thiouridine-forming methyltransferase MnmC